MSIAEIYNRGISFKDFLKTGAESESKETLEILEGVSFSEDSITRLKAVNMEINILVCAELWCPDCRANLPVLEKMSEYNGRIKYRIVSKGDGEELFKAYSPKGEVRIPTFLICDAGFSLLGVFIERPAAVKNILESEKDEDVRKSGFRKYKKGLYAEETLKDILEIVTG